MTAADRRPVGLEAVYPQPDWPALQARRSALLVVDIQRLCAAPDRGMFARAAELGVFELMAPYRRRLEEVVLPNVASLAAAFRAAGAPVIYTRIQSATRDGRDRSGGHVRLGLHVPPGHVDGEILPEIAPEPGDEVIDKTTSGAFVGTGLEERLAGLGVEHVVVCGVLTDECVDSTVRNAADLGFVVSLVEDGCATVEHELHEATVRILGRTYARVLVTGHALQELGEGR